MYKINEIPQLEKKNILVFSCSNLVSVSISNLYPGCENVSVRSRSMMFEPSLTKGVLEVFSPVHSALSTADEQATKAIDIQQASIYSKRRHFQLYRYSEKLHV